MATVTRKFSASFGSAYAGLSTANWALEGGSFATTGVSESTIVPGTYLASVTYDPASATGISFRVPKTGGGYLYTYEDLRQVVADVANVTQIAGVTTTGPSSGSIAFPNAIGTSTLSGTLYVNVASIGGLSVSVPGSGSIAFGNTVSSFAGGAVASVTNPVTVGTNNDKTGYALGSAGLDSIAADTGINFRQAQASILAAVSGASSGTPVAGMAGTIVFTDPTNSTPRITANVDSVGNRTSVTLTPPG